MKKENKIPKKIAEELAAFREFKKNHAFKFYEIEEIGDILYCCGKPLHYPDGSLIYECDEWINAAYNFRYSMSKVLSNLFPYKFYFRGFEMSSIEGCLQSLKYPDAAIQQYVFAYSGADAYHCQKTCSYDWRKTGELYWQGKAMKRDSQDYADFIDELYISAVQNPLYRQALINTKKYILHSIGKYDKSQSILTRFELEQELNLLAEFLRQL